MRSLQQNNLYHELIKQLYKNKPVKVYDGRFEILGFKNPMITRPTAFHIDTFREQMKAFDLEYPRDDKGIVLSSAELTTEQMNKHITFLEVLLMETA